MVETAPFTSLTFSYLFSRIIFFRSIKPVVPLIGLAFLVTILQPFQPAPLCEAVTTKPPSKVSGYSPVAKYNASVGTSPMSTTSQPISHKPLASESFISILSGLIS